MNNDVERCVSFCKKDNLQKLAKELSKGPKLKNTVCLYLTDPRSLDSRLPLSDIFTGTYLRSLWKCKVFNIPFRSWKST